MKLISVSSQVKWGIKLLQTHSRVLQRSLSINSSKEKDVLNVTGDCMVEFKCTNQFYIHVEVFIADNTEFSMEIESFL